MNGLISAKNVIKLSIACIVLILFPIIFFIINFNAQPISHDISDWASFGGYISGIINTFIAVISLIVLAYLTYFVGKQSTLENKNVNLLMRKLDAYESLVSFMPTLSFSIESMTWHLKGIFKYMNDHNAQREYEEYLEKLFEAIRNFKGLHYFLISFGDRYSHLFTYDFDSSDFEELMERSEKMSEYYDKMLENLGERKKEIPPFGDKRIEEFGESLNKFVVSIKKELK